MISHKILRLAATIAQTSIQTCINDEVITVATEAQQLTDEEVDMLKRQLTDMAEEMSSRAEYHGFEMRREEH